MYRKEKCLKMRLDVATNLLNYLKMPDRGTFVAIRWEKTKCKRFKCRQKKAQGLCRKYTAPYFKVNQSIKNT